MRHVLVLLALAAASASAFLCPAPAPAAGGRSHVIMRAEGTGVSRQQQLGGVLRGVGLAGLGAAAFLTAGCVGRWKSDVGSWMLEKGE